VYCLAFAEHAHGSDLSAVETLGVVVDNRIFITGVKTWVAGADRADGALVLCRTAPAELSCVLVPLPSDGVELRPLQVLTGDSDLFELHFDRAPAPLSTLLGERGDGLRVALRHLDGVPRPDLEREFWDLVETARRNGCSRDPLVRQQLAWAYAQVRIIRSLADRQPSLAKLLRAEYHRRFGEIAMDVLGTDGLLRADGEAYGTSRWQGVFLAGRGDTIAAGTTEVQRDVIAEQLLGLPR
jgi:alkylation response protein AidB-like acyl-CoA dehydrogenase